VYLKIELDLLCKNTVNGVKLSVVDKVLYSFMLGRYTHFKGELFDSQEFYATALGVSVGTIKNSINTLKAADLVSTRTEITHCNGARRKNYYTIYQIKE